MTVQSNGLRQVLDAGFGTPLKPLGFAPSRDRQTWMRETGELCHLVGLWKRRESFTVQWGIVCPELVDVMWAFPYKPFDVGQSIVTGTPSSIRHPARRQLFRAAALETTEAVAEVAADIAEDMAVVAGWMEPLRTRQALRDYLLANRDATDRRAFVAPANPSLEAVHGGRACGRGSRSGRL